MNPAVLEVLLASVAFFTFVKAARGGLAKEERKVTVRLAAKPPTKTASANVSGLEDTAGCRC